ncbi:hypothetical protein AAHE18_07G202500 [Arachis hypogaea]
MKKEKEMDGALVEEEMNEKQEEKQDMNNNQRCKGGLITMPFIIGNEALAKMASVGLSPNMILYLIGDYRLRVVKATKIMFFWFAATNFAPLFGAFLADSYLGRFLAIAFGSIITFLGMALLWLTAMIAEARPSPLSHESATAPQLALLITCFALISIGGGGIFCSLAFGADQLNNNNNKKERVLESFISWYIASQAVSVVFSLTAIVYIQDRFGWKLGFGVPAALMLLSTVFFFLLSHRYVKHKPHKSLLTSFAQVIVVAFKNRKLQLPPTTHHPILYHHNKDSTLVAPSHKLRFLNKACIITNNNNNSSWSVCTIEQVEELKAIIKVIPLWSSGFMLSISSSQSSFFLLQAKTMNRHITSSFQIPAGSFSVFIMISVFITAAVYDRLIIPLASKLRGKPVRISAKNRMGIGLFFCFLDLVVSAVVENIRRRKAIREGYIDNPEAVLNMSAMWLIPHKVLNGIARSIQCNRPI